MHIQSALYPRSTIEANSGGSGGSLGRNTIIFIIVGVVCLLVILVGFYLVSRPRAAACNAGPNVPSTHVQHSPINHSPPLFSSPDTSKRWKIWRLWRHTNCNTTTATNTPTTQLSPAPAPISRPSRIARIKRGSKTYPPIVSRPSQARRVTSLSVATSFSHSHITEEAMSDFRASAYDLDGDLESVMLHSARDEIWVGHPLAVEDGRGEVLEEVVEVRGDATPIVEGGVEGDAATRPTTTWRGDDYESPRACQGLPPGGNGVEGDAEKVPTEQTIQ